MYTVEKVEIILTVPSIEETMAWYQRVLGWNGHYDAFDADGRCTFGSVFHGDKERVFRKEDPFVGFNLCSPEQGAALDATNQSANFSALIAVNNVEALYTRVVEKGVTPETGLEIQRWGGRAFSMHDVNGFQLTFYQTVEGLAWEEVQARYTSDLTPGD